MSGRDPDRDRAGDRNTNEGARRREKLERAILQRLGQTDYTVTGGDNIDRIARRIGSGNETFITPNPGDDFEEDRERNWINFKNKFGITAKGDVDDLIEALPQRRQSAVKDTIRDVMEDEGVMSVLEYAFQRIPLDDPNNEQIIDDILDDVPPEVLRGVAENRLGNVAQEIPGGLSFGDVGPATVDNDEILERLGVIAGRTYGNIEQALDDLEQQVSNAESDARREILNRFEAAFGQRFDDVDDAINSLRDQFTQLQNLDIETVEAAFLGGGDTPGVSLPAGFSELEPAVKDIASGVIDLQATADALPSRNRRRAERSPTFGFGRARLNGSTSAKQSSTTRSYSGPTPTSPKTPIPRSKVSTTTPTAPNWLSPNRTTTPTTPTTTAMRNRRLN